MYRSNDYYREIIFNQWFDKHTKIYESMKDGKNCDVMIDIKYAPFITTFNNVYRSNMRYYDTPVDCYSDCMAMLWEGMLKFEIRDGSSWKDIASKKDIDNYKKLVNYLKTYVVQNVKKLNQDYGVTNKTIMEENKKKVVHVYYDIVPESLNKLITFDNSLEKIELISSVEKSYWEEKFNYRYGIFAEWAKDNMYKYLTESQKKLLEELRSANYSVYDNDYDTEIVTCSKGKIKLKLDRICEKISSKYSEHQKLITGGYVVQEIDKEIKAYKKFINAIDNNSNVSQVILSSMNNKYWERLIYDDLSDASLRYVIKAYQLSAIIYEDDFKLFNNVINLPNVVLEEIVNAVIKRIDHLVDARKYEMKLLEKEAESKKVTVNTMQFELPENYSTAYLKVNAYGIMVQK